MNKDRKPKWPILAGLLAGAVGGFIASLVSLPLKSPDDLIGNTATVTIVALVLGLVTGVVWRRLHGTAGAKRKLLGYAMAGFLAASVVLAILEAAVLDRFITFGVPLAAIIFAALGLLTPIFTRLSMPTWVPLAAVIFAMAAGGLLASVGDGASGDLSLDDLPTVTVVATTGAPATTSVPTTAAPEATGLLNLPADLAVTSFTFSDGTATWSVPETFSGGLAATAVGRSESVSGTVDLLGTSEISVDLTTFATDQDRRDSRVRSLFAANPIATFTTSDLTLPATYEEGTILMTDLEGELTINGVTRTVTWAIEARLTGRQLDVSGQVDIVLTDFDVTPPSVGGFVSVEDSARLEVLFSAVG